LSAPARRLASVPSGATAEEVAAIVAALATLDAEDRARGGAARLSGRGAGFTRGPWRLAGRLSRRHRA